MSKTELKRLMQTKTWQGAMSVLYARLQTRNWRDELGRQYKPCGATCEYLQAMWAENTGIGSCTYRVIRIPLETAIDCISGQLTAADYYRKA